MAGEATIGAVRVVLGADTATFTDSLNKASNSLASFGKSITKIAGGIQLQKLFEGAFHAVVSSIEKAIDSADKLGKASQKFGVPVEELSALSYAAELSDVSLDQLGTAIGRLSKNMAGVGDDVNLTSSAFKALGISVRDGNGQLRPTQEILNKVADAFAKFEDGTTKTALAIAIFGRAGADLIPLLNQGSKGIAEMTEQAKKLGLVIDGNTAKQAEQFNDNLKTMEKAFNAIIIKVLGSSGMLDAMANLSTAFVKVAADSKALEDAGGTLGKAMETLGGWFIFVATAADLLTIPARALFAALMELARGEFAKAWEALSTRFVGAKDSAIALWNALKGIGGAFHDTDNAIDSVVQTLAKLDQMRADMAKGKAPLFDPNDEKLAEQLKKKLQEVGLEILAMTGKLPGLSAELAKVALHFKLIDESGKTMPGKAAELFALTAGTNALVAAQLVQSQMDPFQKFEESVAGLNVLLAKGTIDASQYFIAFNQGLAKTLSGVGDATQFMAGGFAELAKKNKAFAVAAKAASIATAIINTYVAATKALTATPWPPVNYALAAATVVAGMGYVAKANAQTFATGGQFRIGGVGATDSKLVSFLGTPGELVDIRRPDAGSPGAGMGGTPGGVQTVRLDVPRPQEFFQTYVRQMVDAINKAAPDGYVIRVAAAS